MSPVRLDRGVNPSIKLITLPTMIQVTSLEGYLLTRIMVGFCHDHVGNCNQER